MDIKKTYIPAKFRNPKLVNSGGSNTTVQGGGGSTEGHTHNNKPVIDQLTQADINVLAKLSLVDGNLEVDANLYSTKELSAYGLGEGSGGGGGSLVVWGTESNGTIPLTVDGIIKTLALKSGLDLKQDKLIAGSGITIVGNTISSTATGGGGTVVSWDTEANGGIGLTVDGISKTLALHSALTDKQDKLAAGSGITIVGNTISADIQDLNWDNIIDKPTTLSGYGITDAYTKMEVNSALNLKLDKSVFDDMFEKVEVSTGVFAIKAKYNFYGVGEISAYGIGSGSGSGGGGGGSLVSWGTEANSFIPLTVEGISKTVALQGHTHTKAQIGLGNVLNVASYSKIESDERFAPLAGFNSHVNDNIRHITGAERTKWDGVVTDFGNLEIGGRNLLISESVQSYQGNPIDVVDGFYCANTGQYGGIRFNKFKLESGNDYVISFEYYTTDTDGWYTISDVGSSNSGIAYGSNKTLNLIKDGNVHKKVIKISATQTKEHSLSLLRAGSTGSVYYKHNSIKVEKGTKATDWTPAPEDQVSDWSTTDINSFSFIKNKPTTIAGYGITDAYTKSQVDTSLNGKVNKSGDTMTGNLIMDSNKSTAWPNTINSNTNNFINLSRLSVNINNNGLHFFGDGATNARRFGIQSGHKDALYTNGVYGILELNPFGGRVKVGVGGIEVLGEVSTSAAFKTTNWKLEQVGTELQLKYNNAVAQRFLLDGSIVGLGEITAYGASTGGEGVSLLRTGGTMTGNLTMSADIIMNSGRSIGKSTLPLKLLGNALTYNASNVLTEANTANQIKMGNGWTIEQTSASLTIRRNGVIKGTFNA